MDYFSRMDPIEMEKTINQMQQIPLSFLQVNLPLLGIPRLDNHVSTLFARLDVLQDQDLVNMLIALILNPRTNHPDVMKNELQMFLGSQTRVFVICWHWLIDIYLTTMEILSKSGNSPDTRTREWIEMYLL